MEARGVRNLRRVAEIRELDERAVGHLADDLGAELVKVAERGSDGRGSPLRADGGSVLVTDDEQHARLDVGKVMRNRRRQHQVDDARLAAQVAFALGAVVDVDEHVDPDVVVGLPLADVVELLLVGLDRGKRGRCLLLVVVIDANVRDALLDVVLEADSVHNGHLVDGVGVLQGEADAQHATERVTDDGDVANIEGVEHAARVVDELVRAELVVEGLGALAEANLVRRNHAVALVGQGADRRVPRRAAKVLAVEEHGRLAIGAARGLNIHKGHLELLKLAREAEHLDRERVRKVGAVEVLGERPIVDGSVGGDLQAGRDAGKRREGRDGAGKRESHRAAKAFRSRLCREMRRRECACVKRKKERWAAAHAAGGRSGSGCGKAALGERKKGGCQRERVRLVAREGQPAVKYNSRVAEERMNRRRFPLWIRRKRSITKAKYVLLPVAMQVKVHNHAN